MITETGYYTLPQSREWGGVDEQTQAKELLTLYFDAAKQGVSVTYVYQLLDAYPDPNGNNLEAHFGLFRLGNTAKPAVEAIHNLTRFLADVGTAPRSLVYRLDRLPATGNSLLLNKADGSFILAVWNEAPVWDAARLMPLNPSPVDVTVTLGSAASVDAYDPLTGVTLALGASATSVAVSVPDHPILLMIKLR